jgi:hypothetical protein
MSTTTYTSGKVVAYEDAEKIPPGQIRPGLQIRPRHPTRILESVGETEVIV